VTDKQTDHATATSTPTDKIAFGGVAWVVPKKIKQQAFVHIFTKH